MFRRLVLISFVVVSIGYLSPSSDSAQKAGWKGKILTEAGVRVMSNPEEPLYDDIRLDIIEELRIGKEGDAQAQFYRIRDIAADEQGNIYVDDYSNGRVQVFNPRGEFLRTIGRPGQGPGEFENPKLVRIGGPKDRVHVMDRFRRINLFDAQGTYLRSIVPEEGLKDYFPAADGGFTTIGVSGQDDSLNPEDVLSRISEDGKRKAVLARFRRPDLRPEKHEHRWEAGFRAGRHGRQAVRCLQSGRSFPLPGEPSPEHPGDRSGVCLQLFRRRGSGGGIRPAVPHQELWLFAEKLELTILY